MTILPCIDYCDTIWGTCSEKNMNIAQRLQNTAARILTKNFDYVNFRGIDLVRSLKWQTIRERRRFHTSVLMFKCIHGYAPNYLCDHVILSREVATHNTRSSERNDVILPFPRKEIFKRSLMYDGASVFNSLPAILKDCDNLSDFKKWYKEIYFI